MNEVTCPFCGKVHTRLHRLLNVICDCNAKYYGCEGFWFHRGTGEKIYDRKKGTTK